MDESDMALAQDKETAAIARGLASIHARLHEAPAVVLADECVDCSCMIPEKRRKALPFCVRCVDCQTDHERR